MDQLENAIRTMAVVGDVPLWKLEQGSYFDEAAFDHARRVLEDVYRTNGGKIIMNRRPIKSLRDVAIKQRPENPVSLVIATWR